METALFWVVWGLISFWALKTFYSSFSKNKVKRLRKAALGINLAIFVLAFLPWLPPSLGGKSGIFLASEGNSLAVLFIILIIIPVTIFHLQNERLYKIGASASIANTLVFFTLMYRLRPGTFTLTLFDIAPIVVFISLLIGNVVVLLLWQQIQLMEKKGIKNN
ncbi:MAG: hypothetical protein AAB508_04080 [Patescibacteria group bacterium]